MFTTSNNWTCLQSDKFIQHPTSLRYVLVFLVNKTNRRTKFQIYWYYDSTCFGQPFRPTSGVFNRTSALVHFMQFWWQFATRSTMEHRAPGSKRSSKLHKMYQSRCTAKNSWWWAERLPETCRVVIPINMEFSASVGFIHKEFATMHGHTILKCFSVFFPSVPRSSWYCLFTICSN